MKEQLIEVMRREGLTAIKLAALLGVQPSAISHIVSGRNRPGYEFIVKLLDAFPTYNPDWLLTGRGEILRSNSILVDLLTEESAANETTLSVDINEQSIDNEILDHFVPQQVDSLPSETIQTSQIDERCNNVADVTPENNLNNKSTEAETVDLPKLQEQVQSAEPELDFSSPSISPDKDRVAPKSIERIIAIYADNTFEELTRR